MNTSITSGQKENLVNQITSAVRKALGTEIDDLVERGILTPTNLQRVLAQGGTLGKPVADFAKEQIANLAENFVGRLKLISGAEKITIGKTDGKGTIANAKDLFTGWLDSDFVNYGTSVVGKPTGETPVQVYEQIKDGNFAQIFGGFGENLDRLVLSQDQIIRFVKDYVKWLHPDGYGTFFLFKVGDEFFVADVYRYVGGLRVRADCLSRDSVWNAVSRSRFVVPQL